MCVHNLSILKTILRCMEASGMEQNRNTLMKLTFIVCVCVLRVFAVDRLHMLANRMENDTTGNCIDLRDAGNLFVIFHFDVSTYMILGAISMVCNFWDLFWLFWKTLQYSSRKIQSGFHFHVIIIIQQWALNRHRDVSIFIEPTKLAIKRSPEMKKKRGTGQKAQQNLFEKNRHLFSPSLMFEVLKFHYVHYHWKWCHSFASLSSPPTTSPPPIPWQW